MYEVGESDFNEVRPIDKENIYQYFNLKETFDEVREYFKPGVEGFGTNDIERLEKAEKIITEAFTVSALKKNELKTMLNEEKVKLQENKYEQATMDTKIYSINNQLSKINKKIEELKELITEEVSRGVNESRNEFKDNSKERKQLCKDMLEIIHKFDISGLTINENTDWLKMYDKYNGLINETTKAEDILKKLMKNGDIEGNENIRTIMNEIETSLSQCYNDFKNCNSMMNELSTTTKNKKDISELLRYITDNKKSISVSRDELKIFDKWCGLWDIWNECDKNFWCPSNDYSKSAKYRAEFDYFDKNLATFDKIEKGVKSGYAILTKFIELQDVFKQIITDSNMARNLDDIIKQKDAYKWLDYDYYHHVNTKKNPGNRHVLRDDRDQINTFFNNIPPLINMIEDWVKSANNNLAKDISIMLNNMAQLKDTILYNIHPLTDNVNIIKDMKPEEIGFVQYSSFAEVLAFGKNNLPPKFTGRINVLSADLDNYEFNKRNLLSDLDISTIRIELLAKQETVIQQNITHIENANTVIQSQIDNMGLELIKTNRKEITRLQKEIDDKQSAHAKLTQKLEAERKQKQADINEINEILNGDTQYAEDVDALVNARENITKSIHEIDTKINESESDFKITEYNNKLLIEVLEKILKILPDLKEPKPMYTIVENKTKKILINSGLTISVVLAIVFIIMLIYAIKDHRVAYITCAVIFGILMGGSVSSTIAVHFGMNDTIEIPI